jgi:flagellin
MPQIINTNIASLNSQRNLNRSQSALQTSLQRLSSGLRINSAKDDAAGLAISERFTTQIRGLNQASRNANDGISLAQTGEASLAEITSNLQRIRELAVQSVNATNSASDRAALDQEVQQRLAEIDRIANQTSFNGQKILDGTFGSALFQVGSNVGETIGLSLNTSMRQADIGAVASASSVDLSTVITEAQDAVANTSGASGAFSDATSDTDGQNFTLTVGGVEILNVTQAGGTPETIDAAELDTGLAAADFSATDITYTGSFSAGDVVFTDSTGAAFDIVVSNDFGTPGGFAGSDFAVATNSIDNGSEAVAAVPLTLSELTVQLGENDPVTVAAGDYATAQSLVDVVNTALGSNGSATLNDDGTMTINASETITVGGSDAGTVFSATEYASSGSLATVNVLDVAASNDAIYRIDSALTSVSSLRGTFGAIQNRFESTIANLSATTENLTAARSRIQDADFAVETANLTRAQILQQAGVAMLAQANVQPQNVLALLQ